MSASTISPSASRIVAPRIANPDMPGKVSTFMQYKHEAISVARRAGLISTRAVKGVNRVLSKASGSLFAATVLSTRTGYHLSVGVAELFVGAASSVSAGTIHAANTVVGYAIWLSSKPVQLFDKNAAAKIRRFGFKATQRIAEFADTVVKAFDHVSNGMVKVLNEPTTRKIVTYSSMTIAAGVFVNGVTGDKIARTVQVVPAVGKPAAAVLRGGKATWIAVGGIFAAAAVYGIGKTVVGSASSRKAAKVEQPQAVKPRRARRRNRRAEQAA